MSEHQEKVYYQTDNWRDEKLPRKKSLSAIRDTIFNSAITLVGMTSLIVAIPIIIANFTYRLIKTLISFSVTWVVGKAMICLFTLIISALLANFGLISEQVGTKMIDTVNNFLFTAHGNPLIQVLPHFKVEAGLIFVLSILLAVGDTYSSLSDIKNRK